MDNQIRVLHIMSGAVLGGVSTVVLNYYQHIDRNKFKFDIAINTRQLGPNGHRLKELGTEIFYLPLKSRNPLKYIRQLKGIIESGEYDVIHDHGGLTSYVGLAVGKYMGVPIRIAHAHSAPQFSGIRGMLKSKASHYINPKIATVLVSCSQDATHAIFGSRSLDDAFILKNAIDVGKFRFDAEKRNTVREALGINDHLVIGTVGNLDPVKNQKYLLEIFASIHKIRQDVTLVIVGEGPLLNELKAQAKTLGVASNIMFLGRRTDVNTLLMGFDVFVMPSLHEGFAIAALEAAASGLPLYLSDKIPKELSFATRSRFLPIDRPPEYWSEEILSSQNSKYDRVKGAEEVIKNGFDIRQNIQLLENIYQGDRPI